MTERDIFLAVLDLPDPAARAAYLDAACAGDVARRAKVEALLQAHESAGSFLAEPAVAAAEAGPANTSAFDAPTAADGDDGALGFLSPPQRPDSLGRIGHYEVLEVLGRGGFGIVFRAHDEVLQRVVAVKVLAPQMAATSPARKRFLREARSSAQIRHENVVQVHAVEEQPLPYLVMEFIPGETLQQRLDRTGPLDVPEVLRIGRQVAEGLAAAHAQGLIHRDIKPANVLIEGGARQRVKLTDFGLARAADDASISQSGIVAGTPMYMAPEQAKGESLDHRADLFSLGSVLYVMCSGRPPFRASGTMAVLKRVCEEDPRPIREVIPEVPEWLCRIVEKLHAKDPAGRFQTAREVADVLADCEAQWKAHGAVKDFSRIPGGKPVRRLPASWGQRLALTAAVVVVLGAGLFVAMRRQNVFEQNLLVPVGKLTPQEPSWVQLFNGKNLDGWYEVGSKGTWAARDGILSSHGGAGYLVNERSYDNFHLKAEIQVTFLGTDFGVLFHTDRVARNPNNPTANGHGVEFSYSGPGDAQGRVAMTMRFTGEIPGTPVGCNVRPFEWLPFDMIVQGDRVKVDIAGSTIGADFPGPHNAGPIILRLAKDDSLVELRNIKIMNLSASSAGEPVPPPAVAPSNAAKSDEELIQGAWTGMHADTQGQPIPEFVAKAVRPAVAFNGSKATWTTDPVPEIKGILGALANFRAEGIFHLDPTKSPKTIDLTVLGPSAKTPLGTPVPRALLGIYKLEGDSLEICIASDPDHVEDRPTKFESVPGKFISHIKLRRQTPAPAAAVAPFDAAKGKEHQEAWAKHFGAPVEFDNSIGLKFRLIPPGEFLMGTDQEQIAKLKKEIRESKEGPGWDDAIDGEAPAHPVRLTRPYYLDTHEVTVAQFRQFVQATAYKTECERNGKGGMVPTDTGDDKHDPNASWRNPFDSPAKDDQPVLQISWNDAQEFCRWLSQKEGRTYRLPTEAEWEFACRAGSAGRFSFGDNLFEQAQNAVFNQGRPAAVGSKKPNVFGLCDMEGNAWEWTEDWYGEYAAAAATDPQGPANGTARVLRGGDFLHEWWVSRPAVRVGGPPDECHFGNGFRVAIGGDLTVNTPTPTRR